MNLVLVAELRGPSMFGLSPRNNCGKVIYAYIYIYPIPIHLLGRRAFLKIGRRSKSSEGYIREIFWGKETAYSI